MRLICAVSSVITEARPTSEPVPAVVGTATTGGTGTLLFSAGPNGEADGLLGALNPDR